MLSPENFLPLQREILSNTTIPENKNAEPNKQHATHA